MRCRRAEKLERQLRGQRDRGPHRRKRRLGQPARSRAELEIYKPVQHRERCGSDRVPVRVTPRPARTATTPGRTASCPHRKREGRVRCCGWWTVAKENTANDDMVRVLRRLASHFKLPGVHWLSAPTHRTWPTSFTTWRVAPHRATTTAAPHACMHACPNHRGPGRGRPLACRPRPPSRRLAPSSAVTMPDAEPVRRRSGPLRMTAAFCRTAHDGPATPPQDDQHRLAGRAGRGVRGVRRVVTRPAAGAWYRPGAGYPHTISAARPGGFPAAAAPLRCPGRQWR